MSRVPNTKSSLAKDFNKGTHGIDHVQGDASGKLMGRIITNMEKGFQAVKSFVQGDTTPALNLAAQAIKALVHFGKRLTTKPFIDPTVHGEQKVTMRPGRGGTAVPTGP